MCQLWSTYIKLLERYSVNYKFCSVKSRWPPLVSQVGIHFRTRLRYGDDWCVHQMWSAIKTIISPNQAIFSWGPKTQKKNSGGGEFFSPTKLFSEGGFLGCLGRPTPSSVGRAGSENHIYHIFRHVELARTYSQKYYSLLISFMDLTDKYISAIYLICPVDHTHTYYYVPVLCSIITYMQTWWSKQLQ